MCCDGHQRPNHTERNRYRPQSGLSKTHGVKRLTQPVFMVNEDGGHPRIGSRDHGQQKEQHQAVIDGNQHERTDGPVIGESVDPDPKVGHRNS